MPVRPRRPFPSPELIGYAAMCDRFEQTLLLTGIQGPCLIYLTLPQIMYTTGREYEMHNVIKAIYQKESNIDFLVVYEMYTTSPVVRTEKLEFTQ